MCEFYIGRVRFQVSVLFPAVFLFLWHTQASALTLHWLVGLIVHESGHLIALVLCSALPSDVVLSAFGIRFHVANDTGLSYRHDVFVAAAGPFMNVIIAIVSIMIGNVALVMIHITLGAINLLPLYPLDGECIVRSVLSSRYNPSVVNCVLDTLFWSVWIVLVFLSVVLLYPPYCNGSMFFFVSYIGFSALLHKGN